MPNNRKAGYTIGVSGAVKQKTKKSKTTATVEVPKRKLKGLPLVRVPDLSARIVAIDFEAGMTEQEKKLRRLMTVDHDHLLQQPEINDTTSEQRAVLSARAYCQQLLKSKDIYMRLAGAFIATRRMYAVFYRELQELLAQEENVPDMTEDYFVQSLMHQAAQPFNEHELMQGFVDTVLPHIAETVDKHAQADEQAELAAAVTEGKERMESSLPIGFRVDLESIEPVLSRTRSLVLVGWRNAVLWVIDQIVGSVLTTKTHQYQVVRLLAHAPTTPDRTRWLIRVAPNHWRGCANNQKSLAVFMGAHVMDKQVQLVDLVVVDDLAAAYTGGFVGRPAGANAGDAHKTLRKWCDKGGAALLGGVLLDDNEPPDLRSPALEQLRTFTDLRGVSVSCAGEGLADDKYRVTVGTSLHFWDVERKVLDTYVPSSVIVPS